jgi:hypothetical protein
MRKRTLLGALIVALAVFGCERDPPAPSSATAPIEDDTTPGVCELHHVPYAVEAIPVRYGYPIRPEYTESQRKWQAEEYAAFQKSFPYSHVANKAGGCVIREAKYAKVSYCQECRKADEEWHAKHGNMPPAEKPN